MWLFLRKYEIRSLRRPKWSKMQLFYEHLKKNDRFLKKLRKYGWWHIFFIYEILRIFQNLHFFSSGEPPWYLFGVFGGFEHSRGARRREGVFKKDHGWSRGSDPKTLSWWQASVRLPHQNEIADFIPYWARRPKAMAGGSKCFPSCFISFVLI